MPILSAPCPSTVLLVAGQEGPGTLGGKGEALARLVTSGYPVPPTGVVTTTAYRSIAEQAAVAELVARVSAGDEIRAELVDAQFAELDIPEPLGAEIIDLGRIVGDGGSIAVRSSATVEDLHGSSFAGQYRSLLNVDVADADAILSAVRAVWAPCGTRRRRPTGRRLASINRTWPWRSY